MSLEYQRLNMVAQLGNDPSALEQQQQQQLALAQQQQHTVGAFTGAEHTVTVGAATGAGAERETGGMTGGIDPSPAMAFARTPSQQSLAVEPPAVHGDDLSDTSFTLSPDGKDKKRPARSGARSLSTSRARKTSTVVPRPLAGRRKSESPARLPRMSMTVPDVRISPQMPLHHLHEPTTDTPEARPFALKLRKKNEYKVI